MPDLTVLNFSGGTGSSFLLELVLAGELQPDSPLVVLCADPGMENPATYRHIDLMEERCRDAGVDFRKTEAATSLMHDLLTFKERGLTRLDNPPYWTRDPATGKRGKLKQGCTQHYKIAPMDREVRRALHEHYPDVARYRPKSRSVGYDVVEKWIGFSDEERGRNKDARQKYAYFRYPLQELGLTKADIHRISLERGYPIPPRSVCNACFANGLDHLQWLHETNPAAWQQAVAVDNAVRDMRQLGVHQEVYVSPTLIPLWILPLVGFSVSLFDACVEAAGDRETLFEMSALAIQLLAEDERANTDREELRMVDESWSCQSGVCFT